MSVIGLKRKSAYCVVDSTYVALLDHTIALVKCTKHTHTHTHTHTHIYIYIYIYKAKKGNFMADILLITN